MITHIVSGFPRSGTSMVMEALGAGGLRLAHANFRQLDHDLYELPDHVQKLPQFPIQYWGRTLKVFMPPTGAVIEMQHIPRTEGRYFIIFVRRHFIEISMSYLAFTKENWPISNERDHNDKFDVVVEIMKARNDCEVVVWNYTEVIESPLRYFEAVPGLKNPIAAAAVPDAGVRHYSGAQTWKKGLNGDSPSAS